MIDPGYGSYQDPRLQPPQEPDGPTCGDCAYYREAHNRQYANDVTHYVCLCVFEVFQADTLEELSRADIVEIDPAEEPCSDFKEER